MLALSIRTWVLWGPEDSVRFLELESQAAVDRRMGMGTKSGPLEGQQALTTTISPALKLTFIAP